MLARTLTIPVALLLTTSCDERTQPSQPPTMSNIENPNENSPPASVANHEHNYEEREGDTYMYVTAVSEEDAKKGKGAGDVLMYRYLGKQGDKFVIVSVNNSGTILSRSECSNPCKIIKIEYGGIVDRMPYATNTVLGSAFQDAINGKLEIAKSARTAETVTKATLTTIPLPFRGEWNEDLSACGTGLSDSRLRISANELQFYESTAKPRSVQIHTARAVTVKATFSGDGQTWNSTVKLTLSGSGDDLTIEGFTRHRCPLDARKAY